MNFSISREQSRRVDAIAIERLGVREMVLMENAGRGSADVLEQLGASGPVVICCGRGNNGGDGLVLARHLATREVPCEVFLCQGEAALSPAANENWMIVRRLSIAGRVFGSDGPDAAALQTLLDAQWIVDGLLGTGAVGRPRTPVDRWIEAINQSQRPVLALDVPSGLDCDTGQANQPTIKATCTATFFSRKRGFDQAGASAYLGEARVVDIGVPPAAVMRWIDS